MNSNFPHHPLPIPPFSVSQQSSSKEYLSFFSLPLSFIHASQGSPLPLFSVEDTKFKSQQCVLILCMRWPISRVTQPITPSFSFSLTWPQDAILPYPLLSHWLLFLSHLGQIFIFFIFWPLDVRVLQVSIPRPVLLSTHVPRFFMLLTHRFLSQVWITLLKFRFPCLIAYSTFPLRCLTGIRNLRYPHPITWAPPIPAPPIAFPMSISGISFTRLFRRKCRITFDASFSHIPQLNQWFLSGLFWICT